MSDSSPQHPAKMSRWPAPCLMLVTDRARLRGRNVDEVVSHAVDGGVNVVQVREKDLPTSELYDLAVTLHAVVRGRALLLVNDRLDVALAAGADGVHLPEHSLPAAKLTFATESCIVGRSVHSVAAAIEAEDEGVDYLLAGTIFDSGAKAGHGVDLVGAVRDAVRIPIVAIGGINAGNAGEIIEAGADGVAVIGAIMDADDPKAAARELRDVVEAAYSS